MKIKIKKGFRILISMLVLSVLFLEPSFIVDTQAGRIANNTALQSSDNNFVAYYPGASRRKKKKSKRKKRTVQEQKVVTPTPKDQPYTGPKDIKKVGVLYFSNISKVSSLDQYRYLFQDITLKEIKDTKSFEIIDQNELEDIIDELRIREDDFYSDDNVCSIGLLAGVDLIVTGCYVIDNNEEISVLIKVVDVKKNKPVVVKGLTIAFTGFSEMEAEKAKKKSTYAQKPITTQPLPITGSASGGKLLTPSGTTPAPTGTVKPKASNPGLSTTPTSGTAGKPASTATKPLGGGTAPLGSGTAKTKTVKVNFSGLEQKLTEQVTKLAKEIAKVIAEHPEYKTINQPPIDKEIMFKSKDKFINVLKNKLSYRNKELKFPWGFYCDFSIGFNFQMQNKNKYTWDTPYTQRNYLTNDMSDPTSQQGPNDNIEGDMAFSDFTLPVFNVGLGGYYKALNIEIDYRWYRTKQEITPYKYTEVNAAGGINTVNQTVTFDGVLVSSFDIKVGWRTPSYNADYGFSVGYFDYKISTVLRNGLVDVKTGVSNASTTGFDTSDRVTKWVKEKYVGHSLGLGFRNFSTYDAFHSDTVRGALDFDIMFGIMFAKDKTLNDTRLVSDDSRSANVGGVLDFKIGYGFIFPKIGMTIMPNFFLNVVHFEMSNMIEDSGSMFRRSDALGFYEMGVQLSIGYVFDSISFLEKNEREKKKTEFKKKKTSN